MKIWLGAINSHANECISKILIGTKVDLEEQREVSLEQGRALAKEMNMPFFETSAKEGTNVQRMIKKVMTYTIDGEIANTPI